MYRNPFKSLLLQCSVEPLHHSVGLRMIGTSGRVPNVKLVHHMLGQLQKQHCVLSPEHRTNLLRIFKTSLQNFPSFRLTVKPNYRNLWKQIYLANLCKSSPTSRNHTRVCDILVVSIMDDSQTKNRQKCWSFEVLHHRQKSTSVYHRSWLA